jgi:hypothetical protein
MYVLFLSLETNVCMHVCMQVCMYVCRYVCIYVHLCYFVARHQCMHVNTYIRMYTCIFMYVCLCYFLPSKPMHIHAYDTIRLKAQKHCSRDEGEEDTVSKKKTKKKEERDSQ